MRWIRLLGLVGLAWGTTAAAQAGELSPWRPPVLTAPHVETAPVLDGKSGDAAWALSPWLALEAEGKGGALSVRLCACATDAALFLQLSWQDATHDTDSVAHAAGHVSLADVVRAVFAATVSDEGTPTNPAEGDPVVFDAALSATKTVSAAGAWSDGRWTVELSRPRGAEVAPAGALSLRLEDGSGPDRATPWAALRIGSPTHARDFEQDEPGQEAAGMRAALAGQGKPPAWLVREKEGRRCLVQECADDTDARFPLALVDGVNVKDVDLSVAFRALDGFKDRAAGLVWRVKDAGNHYILRANALEKNVVLYKMQDNLRVDLPPVGREADYGVEVDFDAAAWHVLRIVAQGERFQAYLDGRLLFDVRDKTFPEAGGVGVWTKSDSVTAFDDLVAVDLDLHRTRPAPPR